MTHEVVSRTRGRHDFEGLIDRAEQVVCEVGQEVDELVEVVRDAVRRESPQEVERGRQRVFFVCVRPSEVSPCREARVRGYSLLIVFDWERTKMR